MQPTSSIRNSLKFYSSLVTTCTTTSSNINKFCILPQCIYLFIYSFVHFVPFSHLTDNFHKHYLRSRIYNGHGICSLWGTKWSFIHNLYERQPPSTTNHNLLLLRADAPWWLNCKFFSTPKSANWPTQVLYTNTYRLPECQQHSDFDF